uniref:Heat shock protein hsp20 n=1 Tax=Tetraselmis sp. GSL018 TaxID=582737 RepID=A0A061R953_9CHLO|mmetsp:Transcript_33587/g.79706  ORF Transcript_33587/g.79706 Transcript_33587/m.79706 type:complete len:147 (-) Transcript_33587:185-625(-)
MSRALWQPWFTERSPFEFDFDSHFPVHSSRNVTNLDFEEHETKYMVYADLPGLGEDDIKLELNNRILTISGEKNVETQDKDSTGNIRVSSRRSRSFKRTVQLPEDVDESSIKATMDKGVLEVSLPKQPTTEPRKIEVSKPKTLPSA